MADLEDNFISDMHTVTDDDSSETESTIQSSLYSGASAAPEEMCCGKPEKQLRVIIIIVASLVMIVAALAAALGVALTKPDCAKGYCNAYHTNYSVVRSMPGQAPSFLRFSQTSHEVSTCSAPRAFVVGGIGTLGWAQRWALSTQEDASHLFDSATDLVLNTSGSLNWPHSVVQDPCTGSIYIANANDDRIDTLSCASSTVDTSNFQVSCDTYNPMASFTSAFFNPLGLHEIVRSGDTGSAGDCTGDDSNAIFLVTGGTTKDDSYLGKYTIDGTAKFLVNASRGEFNKVYSPTVRANGSLLVADAFNNRIAQVDCVDGQSQAISCLSDEATYGFVSTALETFYPRAVYAADAGEGKEVAFVAGGNGTASTTYVKKLDLVTNEVTTVIAGVLNRPHCITVDPETLDLVVCDKGNNRVVRLGCIVSASS